MENLIFDLGSVQETLEEIRLDLVGEQDLGCDHVVIVKQSCPVTLEVMSKCTAMAYSSDEIHGVVEVDNVQVWLDGGDDEPVNTEVVMGFLGVIEELMQDEW